MPNKIEDKQRDKKKICKKNRLVRIVQFRVTGSNENNNIGVNRK